MKIVLLEGLGVSEEIIRKQTKKLNEMGHEFVVYEKNTDPRVQAERCEDADIIMLANMPLSREAIERASHLQYIDVAFTGVDHIPMDEA